MAIVATRKLVIAATVVVALIAALVLDGLSTRLGNSKTSFVYEEGAGSSVFTIVLGGMKADAELHSRQIRPALLELGPTLTAVYDPVRFNAREVALQTAHEIDTRLKPADDPKILILGSSLGTQVGLYLLDILKLLGFKKLHLMAADSPMNAEDLCQKRGAETLGTLWWAGRGQNAAFSRLQRKGVEDRPHDSDSDDAVRLENYQATKQYPASATSDQIRNLARHTAPPAGSYQHVELVVLRSENDTEVRSTADQKLFDAFGVGSYRRLIIPGTSHVSYVEHPGKWQAGIRKGQKILGLRP
ncbi:MAG TPA: alpha/beta fold hydrolase [Candidatus Saccharimonadales bacterium]